MSPAGDPDRLFRRLVSDLGPRPAPLDSTQDRFGWGECVRLVALTRQWTRPDRPPPLLRGVAPAEVGSPIPVTPPAPREAAGSEVASAPSHLPMTDQAVTARVRPRDPGAASYHASKARCGRTLARGRGESGESTARTRTDVRSPSGDPAPGPREPPARKPAD